jgi:DNA-repair protein complementing XP-A cells
MGGFLLDEREQEENADERAAKIQKLTEDEAEALPITYLTCIECKEEFADSYLFKNFDFSCCDKCKDLDEKHELITKTDARTEFLLKDCDFDRREPPLKFISRKNPHKSTWAEMKLYLKLQVKARAMEVHESDTKLLEEKQLREEKREIAKVKKYNKQLSQLRKNVRATLYDKTHKAHVHDYGPSTFNEETDEYKHTCTGCGFVETYEEL